jgi:hypothetical protein
MMAPIATHTNGTTAGEPIDSIDSFKAYDHVHWYVGNAKQAAAYYVTHFGFERVAYRGLETGSRIVASHVVRNGAVTFVFTSPLRGLRDLSRFSAEDQELLKDIHSHLERHGDAVKGEFARPCQSSHPESGVEARGQMWPLKSTTSSTFTTPLSRPVRSPSSHVWRDSTHPHATETL